MKTATYIVTAKSGNTYKWTFTESRNVGDYGNGIYIAVKTPSGGVFTLDKRYAYNYDFRKACVDYLIIYYGDNLDELSEEDEGDGIMEDLYKRFIDEEDLHHWSND